MFGCCEVRLQTPWCVDGPVLQHPYHPKRSLESQALKQYDDHTAKKECGQTTVWSCKSNGFRIPLEFCCWCVVVNFATASRDSFAWGSFTMTMRLCSTPHLQPNRSKWGCQDEKQLRSIQLRLPQTEISKQTSCCLNTALWKSSTARLSSTTPSRISSYQTHPRIFCCFSAEGNRHGLRGGLMKVMKDCVLWKNPTYQRDWC